jgi:DNA primase
VKGGEIMTIFDEVKELVDVPTAARHYGVEVNRSNMAICPFHSERTPSCKLYEKNFHCFGCGEHGDVIDLVGKLFSLRPIEAVRQINSDFGLNLDVDKPPDRADISRIKKQKSERMAYEQWEHHAHKVLSDYLWLLRDFAQRFAPMNPDDEIDERFVYGVHNLDYAEYVAGEFLTADKDEKLQMKDEVERIEREIKRFENE